MLTRLVQYVVKRWNEESHNHSRYMLINKDPFIVLGMIYGTYWHLCDVIKLREVVIDKQFNQQDNWYGRLRVLPSGDMQCAECSMVIVDKKLIAKIMIISLRKNLKL